VTFHLNLTEIAIYLSILLRMSLILFMTPIYSSVHVPSVIKALLSFVLAAIVFILPHEHIPPLPFEPLQLFQVVMGEIIFGMIVSLAILMVFASFQFAGELISFQMGFGFAQVADPLSGVQIGFLSGWFQMIATLIFFSLNGHHMLIKLIVESFQAIPTGSFALGAPTYGKMISLLSQMFVIGLKIGAPAMVALLFTQIGLGLISKFAPQINIMASGFPLTILLGFVFLSLSVSIWANAMQIYMGKLMQFLHTIMR
jgi:flagellar biosynthetic protein FliR